MPLLSNRAITEGFASLEAEARRRVAAGDTASWVLVVPNRIHQRRLEREFLAAADGRAISRLNILTLADLAERLAQVGFPDLHTIDDSQSAVLIELSIRDLLKEGKLTFFERGGYAADSAFPVPRGTFELIVNTIRQLKESGVTAAHIETDLKDVRSRKGETTEARRAADLLEIYKAYQERLHGQFMDTYGQVLLANERYADSKNPIEADFGNAFPGVQDVFITGFYYLEPPSIALIAKLSEVSGLCTTIELEESNSNRQLFEGLMLLEDQLLAQRFRSTERTAQQRTALAEVLARRLFQFTEEGTERPDAPEIECFAAADPMSEIEEIARRIKLIYEEDPSVRADLSQVVIATPSAEMYTPIFEEVFRRHEIPVEIADRNHLDRSPLVLSLLALLELGRSHLRRSDLVRVLSSPYFVFRSASGELLDSRNLLDVLTRYHPTGNWEAILHSLAARGDEAAKRKSEAEDTSDFEREEAEERRISRAIRDFHALLKLVRPFTLELTPPEFCTSLRNLLAELRASERLLASSRVTQAMGTLELDTRAYRALAKLLEELESLFRMMGIAPEKRSIAYYEQRLKAALILRRYSARTRSHAVLVTTLAQSISLPAKYRFVAGLSEGVFPAPYQPQVFLTGSIQKKEQDQLLEDRVLFYQAITNFESRLFLSYPKRRSGGAEQNASSFLDALNEVVAIEEAKPASGLFSYRDVYRATRELPPAFLESFADARPEPVWLRAMREQVPHGATAISARRLAEESSFQGWIDPAQLEGRERESLDSNRGRVWSITQLERYANCPFHFFAHDILGLNVAEEHEEGLDALDKGSALHEVLRKFLLSRREQKLEPIQDVPEHALPEIEAGIREMAAAYFQRIARDHPFWRIDSERLLSTDRPGGSIFQRFLQKERELAKYRPRPAFFEVSFGGEGRARKSPHDPELMRQEPMELGGLKLRGKIDRIDVAPVASEDGDLFTIIDYKSGKRTASRAEIDRGLSLQLPLYLRVAEDLLRSHLPELKGVAAAALYQKVGEEKSPRKLGLAVKAYANEAFEKELRGNGLVETQEELAAIMEEAIRKAKIYVEGVAAGRFPLAESDLLDQCKHCHYGAVCRVREAEAAGVLRRPA